jgi:hypothetical protein
VKRLAEAADTSPQHVHVILGQLRRAGPARRVAHMNQRTKPLKLKPRPHGKPNWRTRWTPPQDAPAVVTTRTHEQAAPPRSARRAGRTASRRRTASTAATDPP